MIRHLKVGVIGTGHLGEAIIKGLVSSGKYPKEHILASNRSPRKLQKVAEKYGIQAVSDNEEIIDKCDVILLAMRADEIRAAVESLNSLFREQQIIVSLAAGLSLKDLQRLIPHAGARVARVMCNLAIGVRRGVIGYCLQAPDEAIEAVIEDLFSPLGLVKGFNEGEEFEALTVISSSGTGFVYELMQYWQEWIEERGIDPETARAITVQTFLGAAELALEDPNHQLSDLQNRVTLKKGVIAAGLQSMRELEVERALRYSFEKAALRNTELGKS